MHKQLDTLVVNLSKLLLDKGIMLVAAESCTGGMLSCAMTEQPGCSKVFDRGFITYTNESKQEILGVPKDILEQHGAVSEECAAAMVSGALKNSHAGIAASITGIAGPSGGSDRKPVGLVYIGIGVRGQKPKVYKCNFHGNRADIRHESAVFALTHLIECLK